MGFVGGSPNLQNITATITLPENVNLLSFEHVNRSPDKERQWKIPSDNTFRTIPAGYFFLEIYNPSLNQLEIEANAIQYFVSPGEKWVSEDRLDWQHKKQELGPSVKIRNNTGDPITVHVCYPNDSVNNPYTI